MESASDAPTTPSAGEPLATIVVVPRERFSLADESLESIYANTEPPFNLVYVDGNSPRKLRDWLAEQARVRGLELVRSDRYLSPNQARNLGLKHVKTKYVVFCDNDLFVTPGWLSTLVACAEETGAWVVGPLYFQGDPAERIIHMAEGWIEISGEAPNRSFKTTQSHQGVCLDDLPTKLERHTCDYAEFHCMLLRTDVFEKLGPLDEDLMNTREHLDICMRVREAGGQVWFEPAAHVTYRTPPPFDTTDIPFYWTRWSEAWGRRSLARFCEKYGLDTNYSERVANMAHRRQRVFAPVQQTAKKIGGKKAAAGVKLVLSRVEPRVNRLLVKAPSRTP